MLMVIRVLVVGVVMAVCNIFAPEVSKFPPVTRVGDILRCHRVKSQVYQVRDRGGGDAGSLHLALMAG